MSIRADRHVEKWLNRLNYIDSLLKRGKLDKAWSLCEDVLQVAEKNGWKSSHLYWSCAVVRDSLAKESGNAEDFVAALDFIRLAAMEDPLSLNVFNSFHIIVERIRDTLHDTESDPANPLKGRLWQALVAADEVTPECHLAYARHLHAAGRPSKALEILSSLTLLHPANRDAWELLAEVAGVLGDTELALRAMTEAKLEREPSQLMLAPMAQA